ncbi:hypothetical protein WJX72_010378 [[Myrmecia] bisecta]|uniref:Thymidine kinase n=1 Tax=[Myrmecia] bisecta TaxID=41462 RepID=A0AAW1PMF3_9CHLO
MFAGKTSELLRRVSALEALGRRVAVIKSFKDDRYHATNITTHDGISRPCYALTNLREFKDSMADRYSDAEVIAIDEAQFFPDLHQFCTDAADRDGKLVILAGLDGDFKRKRFGQVLDLIPVADSVTKLKANCAYCSSRALFSLRIAADDRQEVVGGADKYAPVCRQHYVSLSQLRVEADTD